MNDSDDSVEILGDDDFFSSKTWTYVQEAFERTLENYESNDYSILAYALTLPSQGSLTELIDTGDDVDPIAIHTARGNVKKSLARKFQIQLKKRYDSLTDDGDVEFKVDSTSIGRRLLRNVCLQYLCSISTTEEEQTTAAALAKNHYETATCMTDKVSALNCLASMDGSAATSVVNDRDEIIQRFYEEANGDALVLDKWFAIQAMADLPDILDRVKALKEHPDFTLKNPNRCRSLIGYVLNSEIAIVVVVVVGGVD